MFARQKDRIEPTPTPEVRMESPVEEDAINLGKCVQVYSKGAKAIDIERGGEPVESFQYGHLTHRSQFTPECFWFIFGGHEKHKVVVHGRNLRDLYNRWNDWCVRKIRTMDRGFDTGDDLPFITRIDVVEIRDEE